MTPSILGWTFHQATISAVVLDSTGKLVMECILETKAATILQFVRSAAIAEKLDAGYEA
jgi:hypothetical protein